MPECHNMSCDLFTLLTLSKELPNDFHNPFPLGVQSLHLLSPRAPLHRLYAACLYQWMTPVKNKVLDQSPPKLKISAFFYVLQNLVLIK
jgi:hypothetical protein